MNKVRTFIVLTKGIPSPHHMSMFIFQPDACISYINIVIVLKSGGLAKDAVWEYEPDANHHTNPDATS
jgi:hypothetical protein